MSILSNAHVPILGFAAFSGVGKTTLLCGLIPWLNARGVRVGLVKHAHHDFEIDYPGKDSYELRKAGASPVMLSSSRRRAVILERGEMREPVLNEELAHFDQTGLDLILVEGFKRERFPKIELHRPALGKPLLFPEDDSIIAIATDGELGAIPASGIPVLDLNDVGGIGEFVGKWKMGTDLFLARGTGSAMIDPIMAFLQKPYSENANMGKVIFKEEKKYTFSDYFYFTNPTEEIANAFGYSFATKILDLPSAEDMDKSSILALQESFYAILPKISLDSEMAKRDFMIAPILWEVIRHAKAKINVEYQIDVDNRLSGSLGYLVRSHQELIVIEAKKGNIDKGFNQLVVEMIALDMYEEKELPGSLYGAVSIGELWRFGILGRNEKSIYRDLHTYRVPEDIEKVFTVMLGILQKI